MFENQEILRMLLPVVLAHVVILVVIVLIIKKLLLGDTVRAVNRIGQAEAEIRKREEAMKQELERHEQEAAARKREADEELESQREELEREAARQKEQALEEARRESAEILEKARKNERRMREQMSMDMDDKAIDVAGRVFQLVFSDRLTETLNAQFTGELIDALAETDASGITVDATAAAVTASHSLAPEHKERLQRILAEKFDVQGEIDVTIDEELLAGLVLKIGSLEIDGSLRSRYQEAVSELKKEVV